MHDYPSFLRGDNLLWLFSNSHPLYIPCCEILYHGMLRARFAVSVHDLMNVLDAFSVAKRNGEHSIPLIN